MDDPPVFRAAKRRKYVRTKEVDDTQALQEVTADEKPDQAASTRSVSPESNITSILKSRRQGKPRNIGIQVTNTKVKHDTEDNDANAMVTTESNDDYVKRVTSRFVGSTGQVVDVDKHMTAFVDSEMARRHHIEPPQQSTTFEEASSEFTDSGSDAAESTFMKNGKPGHQQNAHQLSEVDLGPSATSLNLARTEAAIARAQAGLPPPVEQEKPRKRRKPRLGRDGKPMRPRPRKRRDSADIARDALVEQVLHEHALDVYEKKGEDGKTSANGGVKADQPNDESFAEEFRQQFMDAIADRQQRQKASQAKVSSVTGTVPQGPKLGGGRSGRAMMAQMQAQANTDKGK